MQRIVLFLLIAMGLAVACGDSSGSAPESTKTATDDPTQTTAEHEASLPSLGVRLDRGDVTWSDTYGEETYKVTGLVDWGPGCEHRAAGFTGSSSIRVSEALPADTTRYSLPKPDDSRLSLITFISLSVTATDASGNPIAEGTFSAFADPVCPP